MNSKLTRVISTNHTSRRIIMIAATTILDAIRCILWNIKWKILLHNIAILFSLIYLLKNLLKSILTSISICSKLQSTWFLRKLPLTLNSIYYQESLKVLIQILMPTKDCLRNSTGVLRVLLLQQNSKTLVVAAGHLLLLELLSHSMLLSTVSFWLSQNRCFSIVIMSIKDVEEVLWLKHISSYKRLVESQQPLTMVAIKINKNNVNSTNQK